MASWKEAAGRDGGNEGYRFGDVSRSLLRKLNLSPRAAETSYASWRASAGRTGGDDGSFGRRLPNSERDATV